MIANTKKDQIDDAKLVAKKYLMQGISDWI